MTDKRADAPAGDVTDERLAELIRYHSGASKVLHTGSPFRAIHEDSAECIRELQRRRAADAALAQPDGGGK